VCSLFFGIPDILYQFRFTAHLGMQICTTLPVGLVIYNVIRVLNVGHYTQTVTNGDNQWTYLKLNKPFSISSRRLLCLLWRITKKYFYIVIANMLYTMYVKQVLSEFKQMIRPWKKGFSWSHKKAFLVNSWHGFGDAFVVQKVIKLSTTQWYVMLVCKQC